MMQHSLMSNEPSSSAPLSKPSSDSDAQVLEFRRPRGLERTPSLSLDQLGADEQDLGPLRGQVTEIIDAILAETGPEEAEVRDNLRRQVANHPGQPEKALLKHLLNLSAQQEETA
ncbi:hypothetical protein E5206_18460 [Arthrobacter sp. PAMC25564]|uniref:hypothetical protein n=1 Tax=Arthrobacter sp. PAMC25564 TaxID=2565366 RepID=UPI0010A22099|nr:hypothetical protein [Arthrobacter sp. PAMC25564]QCB98644.1 hypothetical protein E5206_18460 [Arthrobacter sp. PAMC25564]